MLRIFFIVEQIKDQNFQMSFFEPTNYGEQLQYDIVRIVSGINFEHPYLRYFQFFKTIYNVAIVVNVKLLRVSLIIFFFTTFTQQQEATCSPKSGV